jgi:hypothetical protein
MEYKPIYFVIYGIANVVRSQSGRSKMKYIRGAFVHEQITVHFM